MKLGTARQTFNGVVYLSHYFTTEAEARELAGTDLAALVSQTSPPEPASRRKSGERHEGIWRADIPILGAVATGAPTPFHAEKDGR